MISKLPSQAIRRASITPLSRYHLAHQTRYASLLRRPHRPYTFTQLVTLSDGSTYLTRTTSPAPVYKSTKDTRNHPMWQPSLSSLRNVEEDEAGRLRAFREKFGRGWDADTVGKEQSLEGREGEDSAGLVDENESFMDLISGYTDNEDPAMRGEGGKKK